MNRRWVDLVVIIQILFLLGIGQAIHVYGRWNSQSERVQIITKFGFQETNALDQVNTRGYVYGNITTNEQSNNNDSVIFALVPEAMLPSLYSDSVYGASCASIMRNISEVGFDSRCFPNGTADILRWIPCPKGELCRDEDDPKNVLPGYQLTMRVQEPTTAEYWYIALIACELDDHCLWRTSRTQFVVDYDIWLTNGKPGGPGASPFTIQFSFDEQNTPEMYALALIAYLLLCAVYQRALKYCKHSAAPPKLRLFSYILHLKTVGIALQCLNVVVYSFDGEGLVLARVFGELLRVAAVDLLCLLLILLARGWSFSPKTTALSRCFYITSGIFLLLHFFLFCCNVAFVSNSIHNMDVFTSWPGYGMILLRITFALWFLFEIRRLILREQFEERAVFLAHIGAGFLVWFVYLPALGVVASFISQLWRFKIILAITSLANYVAIACILHIFWPTGSYRNHFHDDLNYHRRINRTESHEMQDFERLLFESSDSGLDFPQPDASNNLHSI